MSDHTCGLYAPALLRFLEYISIFKTLARPDMVSSSSADFEDGSSRILTNSPAEIVGEHLLR